MPLNDQQKNAINNLEGPICVYAGAGTGKTTVLVARLRKMLQSGINPQSILVVTFANKATNILKTRISDLNSEGITISTIHKFCVSVLRRYEKLLNYPKRFIIIDDDDQKQIVKKIVESLDGSDEEKEKITYKEFELSRFHPDRCPNIKSTLFKKFILEYKKFLEENAYIDFTGLLEKTDELLIKNPEVLEGLQNKFKYLLIDEFHDTDYIQYSILKKIFSKSQNFFLVGDEDQSIYSFRGANYENLKAFQKDFKNHQNFILDLNYRSGQKILDLANTLISHNKNRFPKNLVSFDKSKNSICEVSRHPFDISVQVQKIFTLISAEVKCGKKYSDYAILARNANILMAFEKACIAKAIPYNFYGGIKYYRRKEIKNLFAFLYLALDEDNFISFTRAISLYTKGIGAKTILKILEKKNSESIISYCLNTRDYSKAISEKLNEFAKFIKNIREKIENEAFTLLFDDLILYCLKDTEKSDLLDRTENVKAFFDLLIREKNIASNKRLSDIIYDIFDQIMTDSESEKTSEGAITISTIHSIKGLEFDTVWITGLNEGVLPDIRHFSTAAIEEERRILYVAITRAKRRLFLYHGPISYFKNVEPSRFLKEINEKLFVKPDIIEKFKIGDSFFHDSFGKGVIIGVLDSGCLIEFHGGETCFIKFENMNKEN